MAMELKRCQWAQGGSDAYIRYHDEEWGVPRHDDRLHFEFLILESAQAGLSWNMILNKREGYRKAFSGFDPAVVAGYNGDKINQLLRDPSIVRNRAKIEAAVNNAGHFLNLQQETGSFDEYVWEFVHHQTVVGGWKSMEEVPAKTTTSDNLAKDLKQRGFRFLGSTIIYAYMQALGLVNDHTTNCFRYGELTGNS